MKDTYYNIEGVTYVNPLTSPPIIIILPSIVMAPCDSRPSFKLPARVQMPPLYFAIVDDNDEPVQPPMM